jgi:hypothetical protein
MQGYSIASQNALGGSAPAPLLTITPGSSRAVALLGAYQAGDDSGTFASRIVVTRASAGATPTSRAIEKHNRLGATADATAAEDWGTLPTDAARPLIVMPTVGMTTGIYQRRWVTPNPRYTIQEVPSGNKLHMENVVANGGPQNGRSMQWAEAENLGAVGFGRWGGRRGRRGGFFIQDHSGGFAGVSGNPKHHSGSASYLYLNANEWVPQDARQDSAVFLNLLNAVAGTTYTISLDGSVTPTGSLVRQVGKALAGSATATGALLRQTQKALAGSITAAGALAKQLARTLAGSVTPTGALTRQIGKALASSTTAAGAIVKQVGKALGGSVTVTGALAKLLARTLAGSVAASGSLVRQVGKALDGSVTAAGGIVRQVGKACAGTITAAGTLAKETRKTLAGSVTPAGALAVSRAILLFLSGSVTATGSLTRQVGKGLSGSVSAVGDLAKSMAVTFAGSVAATGELAKQVALSFSGSVAAVGGLLKQIGKALAGIVSASGSLTTSGGAEPEPPHTEGHRGPWPRARGRRAPYPQRGPLALPRWLKRRKD